MAASHPTRTKLTRSLSNLRDLDCNGPVDSDERIVDGIFLSWDTEEGDVSVNLDSREGSLGSVANF